MEEKNKNMDNINENTISHIDEMNASNAVKIDKLIKSIAKLKKTNIFIMGFSMLTLVFSIMCYLNTIY